MSASQKQKLDAPVAPWIRRALARLVEKIGENAVAARAGTSPETLARCLAGLPVRNGTRVLIEMALEQDAS